MFVSNLCFSLVAALKDRTNVSGVSKVQSINVFGARKSSACFVKETHLSPLQNSKIVVPFLVFLVKLNWSRLINSRSPVTFKYLCNAASFSHFTFCVSHRVYVGCLSVGLGVVNFVSLSVKFGAL